MGSNHLDCCDRYKYLYLVNSSGFKYAWRSICLHGIMGRLFEETSLSNGLNIRHGREVMLQLLSIRKSHLIRISNEMALVTQDRFGLGPASHLESP